MKKPLIYTSIAALTLLVSGGLTLAISNVNANTSNNQVGVAVNVVKPDDPSLNPLNQLNSQDENVYIITDTTGAANKVFINSTLSTSDEALPVTLHITYYLNGSEISAQDLAGQSGHVKISYHYTATKKYQNKLVPFLAATGIQLDGTKFSNVKLNNGKILSEDGGYTILGYSFAGLNENLGTDLLPDTFTIEADVTNFELGNSYTFASNEIIAELDTSKLNTVDNIISAINQLSDGLDQILTGSRQLDSGLDSLAAGITKLQSGATDLSSGANQLATGLTTLNDKVNSTLIPNLQTLGSGLDALSANSAAINDGVQSTFTTLLTNLQTVAATTTDPTTQAMLSQIISSTISNLPTLYTQLGTYTGTVDYIAAEVTNLDTSELVSGVATLASGANQLATGTSTLKAGIDQLASGASQLSAGSKALNSGLATFKSSGIDRLTSIANNDLASLATNLRASVSAARSYHSYGDANAKSVKFIFKTPSIK